MDFEWPADTVFFTPVNGAAAVLTMSNLWNLDHTFVVSRTGQIAMSQDAARAVGVLF